MFNELEKLDWKKINNFICKKLPTFAKSRIFGERTALKRLQLEGKYFLCLTSGGIKKEAESQKNGFYKTKKEAEKAYLKELKSYLETQTWPGHKARLEWRMTPRIWKTELGYKIYSRLLVL